jgi:hypothetical protein
MLVFHETCHVHIECRDVRAIFFFFFDILKMFFRMVGAYAPMSRIEFPGRDSHIDLTLV